MVQEGALNLKHGSSQVRIVKEKEVMAKKFNEVLAVKRLGIFFY